MNMNGESRKWLLQFYNMDGPSVKDLLLAKLNLVLNEEAVSQVQQRWDSIFLELEEGVIGAKLEDLPVASLISEPSIKEAIEIAKNLRESKKSRIIKALEDGGWGKPPSEAFPPRTGKKPGPKPVELAFKFFLGVPYHLLKEQEKAKQRASYLQNLRDKNVEWARLKALRNADKCALTSVKRAHDAVFARIPEDLWRRLLFCSPARPNPGILGREAAKAAEAIRAMMGEKNNQEFESPRQCCS